MIEVLYEHLNECGAMATKIAKTSGSVTLGLTAISGAKDVAFKAFHEGKISQDQLAKFIDDANKIIVGLAG